MQSHLAESLRRKVRTASGEGPAEFSFSAIPLCILSPSPGAATLLWRFEAATFELALWKSSPVDLSNTNLTRAPRYTSPVVRYMPSKKVVAL